MTSQLGISRRPEALLLDAGDTLIFFDGRAMADALATEGIAVEGARLEAALHPAKQRYSGHLARGHSHMLGWDLLMLDLMQIAGVQADRAQAALPAVKRAHFEFNFWRRVPAGLLEALTRARAAGIRLGVISNSEGKLRDVLERVALWSHFEVALDSELEGVRKPDPEIFMRALARMGVRAQAAVYAGDVPEVDVLGARAVGMAGVLVDTAGHFADRTEWPRVQSTAALIDALIALPPG